MGCPAWLTVILNLTSLFGKGINSFVFFLLKISPLNPSVVSVISSLPSGSKGTIFLGYSKWHTYRKIASRSMSQLVRHQRIFRMCIKGKFDTYVLCPLAEMLQNWIVARSTACNYTVNSKLISVSNQIYLVTFMCLTFVTSFIFTKEIKCHKMFFWYLQRWDGIVT